MANRNVNIRFPPDLLEFLGREGEGLGTQAKHDLVLLRTLLEFAKTPMGDQYSLNDSLTKARRILGR